MINEVLDIIIAKAKSAVAPPRRRQQFYVILKELLIHCRKPEFDCPELCNDESVLFSQKRFPK